MGCSPSVLAWLCDTVYGDMFLLGIPSAKASFYLAPASSALILKGKINSQRATQESTTSEVPQGQLGSPVEAAATVADSYNVA